MPKGIDWPRFKPAHTPKPTPVICDIHLKPKYLPLHGLKTSVPPSLERESQGTSESNISGVQEGIATEPATDQNQPQ